MSTTESTTRAAGSFEIGEWEDETFDDQPGAKLGKVRLTKTFSGDLEATSVVNMLAVSTPTEGDEFQGAAYVAVERVHGAVHGRRGGFVLTHTAGEVHGMKVAVVPGSGTGELTGITGEIVISRHDDGSHTYVFDYRL
jgi:hypothetical protein